MGSITLIAWVVALLDWYGRRRDRDSKRAA
jgi:hypothetical protein